LTGYELDVESPPTGQASEDAPKEAEGKTPDGQKAEVESKPVVQKLKKKTELEDSLLKAIEEHGE
jgi:hypothetical protein